MKNTKISLENRYTDYDLWSWLYNLSEADLVCNQLLPILKKIFDLCGSQLYQKLIAKGDRIVGLDGSEKMLHLGSDADISVCFVVRKATVS